MSTDPVVFSVLAHSGAIFNGLAGVTVMAAPPAISAAWFPPSQRTTATSISQLSNVMGCGLSSILGPLMVPDSFINDTGSAYAEDAPTKPQVRRELRWFMLTLAAPAAAAFAAMVLYFPSKPPTPPSASGAVPRTDFSSGLRCLLRNRDYWLAAFSYAGPGGISAAWTATIALILRDLGVREAESGLMIVVTQALGVAMAMAAARALDRPELKRRLRGAIIGINIVALVFVVWLALLCLK